MATPDRWMHLRHPDGFGPEAWQIFQANCRIFAAYVHATLAEADALDLRAAPGHPDPAYTFHPPTLSPDRAVASLPISGPSTLGTRGRFENASAWMLSDHLLLSFRLRCEEGLTEPKISPQTAWRPVSLCRISVAALG